MRADFKVVLDACVLLPMPLADTLLRLAAERLYLARWTQQIMDEVSRNLIETWGKSQEQAQRRESAIRQHFPECWVEGYEDLIPAMKCAPKDRHVLAAAVRCNAEVIVTYNIRDFPAAALEPYTIAAIGPSTFLRDLYGHDPGLVRTTLHQQAADIGQPPDYVLERLAINVPGFIAFLRREIETSG